MDLLNLLKNAGGGSVQKLADQLGIPGADAGRLISAVAPALEGGLQKQAASSDGLAGLRQALERGGHERYLDRPELLEEPATRDDGNAILGHLFGSKAVSREVAAEAAAETGFDASLIKKALPLLAGLTMGAVSKRTGRADDADSTGGLASLLGMLNSTQGKDALGGVVNLARKLF